MKYLIILFLLFNTANAQLVYIDFLRQPNTNSNIKSYVGNVKKVNRIYWSRYLSSDSSSFYNSYIDSFQYDGKCVFSIHLSKDSIHNNIANYHYNSLGNCISIVGEYLSNDSISHEGYNTYNSANQLTNSKTYYKGKLSVENNITYNKSGDIETREILTDNYSLEKMKKNFNKLTVTSYDIAGKKIMKQDYIEDDTSIYCHYYSYQKYNASGKEGETRMYKKDNQILYALKRIYDYDAPNQNWSAIETQYDEHKNLTKLVTYDKLKKRNYTTIIDYKYDSVGNITEKLITYDNGDKELGRYEFEYY